MNIRIISGKFGGRIIDAPGRSSTHAMSERVRNAMFNSIGGDVKGAIVLDAFAGSGSVGFEALSRGAHHVTFVENDRIAAKVIAKNIALLGVEEQTTLIRTTVLNWISTSQPQEFDLIFADPPYHTSQPKSTEELLGLLKHKALMVLSHPGKGEVCSKTGVVVVDNRSYGNAHLTFFRRENA